MRASITVGELARMAGSHSVCSIDGWIPEGGTLCGRPCASSGNIGGEVLELRPTCENCNTPLPPDSLDARICTYECTFCVSCVDDVLHDVCPNCGGGFVPRPVRPATNWKDDNYLGANPASTTVKHRPVDPDAHTRFAAKIRSIPPGER